MIVWLNGAFGAGKTSTARELVDLIPNSTLYDPEATGGSLRALLPAKRLAEVEDYQDLPMWRRLVVDTAAALLAEVGGVLVVPMTLLRQEYRDEIFGGLAARRIDVRHVLLASEETILRRRIEDRADYGDPETDARVRDWCHAHLAPYREALGWLAADAYTVDTSALSASETARDIADALESGRAASCGIVQTPRPTRETLASGVLLFDEHGRFLLVDPTYKPGWEFPGGVVESGEAPARAGMREVTEELGLELAAVPRLLLVDWEPPEPPAYGGLRFLFDGGGLGAADIGRLRLPGAELRDWRFVTEEEAADLLPPVRYRRLRWALRARERGTVLNLEAGVPAD
ncbi:MULTISPECIES: NUDIX hydrolase [unclassified Streptomyces]|uniref:NUDIX hydrolase n=1 Tax=unclassified Streptomyces TaxID=2593676 RepID=UPI0016604D30|nr:MULTISPECIES: NUDIX hydrolase [unclassified Streptomyces]MBD0710360.1 ATP/GTP-binding protein [Streptomyces sp. CBMA291]MBD0712695.1 ATP/GTP-binding protein [Streptomyces sp. CBMA370]